MDYFYTGQLKLAENFFKLIGIFLKSHYIFGFLIDIFLDNITIIKKENIFCFPIYKNKKETITCILCEDDLKSLNHAQMCIIKENAILNRCEDNEALKEFALSWIANNACDFREGWDNSKT